VTGQLFVAEIHPGALEYSLYALAQTLIQLVLAVIFLWIRPKLSVKLETWLIIGYGLILIIPLWGCIGLSNVDFGFKVHRIWICFRPRKADSYSRHPPKTQLT